MMFVNPYEQFHSALVDHAARCGEASMAITSARLYIGLFEAVYQQRGNRESDNPRQRQCEIFGNDAAMLVEEVLGVAPERLVSERPESDERTLLEYLGAANEFAKRFAGSPDLSGIMNGLFFVMGTANQIRFNFKYAQHVPIEDICGYVTASILRYATSNLNQHNEAKFFQSAMRAMSIDDCASESRSNPAASDLSEIGDKDLRKLIRVAVEQGFILERLSGKRFRVYHPDLSGMVVFASSGDPRAIRNTAASLKRIGVVF